jgi:hypothetical protein
VTFAVWLLWAGLAASLSLALSHWPVMFIIAGSFIATALIFASIELPTGQLESTSKSVRHVSILAAMIGFGIFIQIMPLQLTGLAQPFWTAMGAAIRQPTVGYITVDTASTIVALTKYLVILGAALMVALSCNDQAPGSQMSSAIAWILLIFSVGHLVKASVDAFQSVTISEEFWADWISLSMLGVLMNGAILVRYKLKHSSMRLGSKPRQLSETIQLFAPGAVMIALFAVPFIAHRSQADAIPAIFGISAFLTVLVAKRMRSDVAGMLFTAALVICGLWLAALTLGVFEPHSTAVFGNRSETDIATVVRIFRDFRWFGSGAGTYSALIPIYEGIPDSRRGLLDAPPAALSVLIELGIPLTLLAAALALVLVWTAFSAVARNDRDYSRSVLACSTLVYIIAIAFTPGTSLSFSTMIVAAMIISLGLTQVQLHSRTSQSSPAGAWSAGRRASSPPY